MCCLSALITVIIFTTPGFAGLTALQTIEKYAGQVTGRSIVQLKNGVSKATVMQHLKPDMVTHDWNVINGFAAHLDADTIGLLRASSDVESISEDGIMHTMTTQTNAPWGLSHLNSNTRLVNQNTSALNFSYTYDRSAGTGVDIYSQFGGRARWGATFGPYANVDRNGHGTHCAGIAAGSQFGVAKSANIITVKVLSDDGSGSIADIISGANFALANARASGRPSVVSMSIGGNASTVLDNAVASLTSNGVYVVVSAGNANVDAINTSPARAPSAIAVGVSTIADTRASFSNFGSVVDVFAPGEILLATQNISGTSMAAAQVAGLVAYILGLNPNPISGGMIAFIKSTSLKSALTDIPTDTLNVLAHLPPT
ncbi:serine protease [Collybia nuda]|uniref:Serine protease n=1 Tax=Collybia nuda TaxID=64659 RepID=A0A9P5XXW4_9AGAR|nr:serine protease [Collybia nuda]